MILQNNKIIPYSEMPFSLAPHYLKKRVHWLNIMELISRRLHKRGLQWALSSAQFSLKLNISKSMKHTQNFHFSDHSKSQFNMYQLGFCQHNWLQQSDFQKSLASASTPKQMRLSEQALHTRCWLLWKICTQVSWLELLDVGLFWTFNLHLSTKVVPNPL